MENEIEMPERISNPSEIVRKTEEFLEQSNKTIAELELELKQFIERNKT